MDRTAELSEAKSAGFGDQLASTDLKGLVYHLK